MTQLPLNGKVALITGASRGIGLAIAQAYVAAGAKVVLSSRKQEGLDEAASMIREQGGEALPVAAHSSDSAAVQSLVEQATAEWGGIDITVSQAADGSLEFSPGAWGGHGQRYSVGAGGSKRVVDQLAAIRIPIPKVPIVADDGAVARLRIGSREEKGLIHHGRHGPGNGQLGLPILRDIDDGSGWLPLRYRGIRRFRLGDR